MPITHDYYGYKMTDDTGFAPSITNEQLVLACCMTQVRRRAPTDSWIAGWGGKAYGIGKVIYLMQVERCLTFDQYFREAKFKERVDNIYRRVSNHYEQIPDARCHRSQREKKHDLSVDRVLVASRFVYFGQKAISVADRFRDFVPRSRTYKAMDGPQVNEFAEWVLTHGSGIKGDPHKALPPAPATLVQLR